MIPQSPTHDKLGIPYCPNCRGETEITVPVNPAKKTHFFHCYFCGHEFHGELKETSPAEPGKVKA